jgi:hypothetical protein
MFGWWKRRSKAGMGRAARTALKRLRSTARETRAAGVASLGKLEPWEAQAVLDQLEVAPLQSLVKAVGTLPSPLRHPVLSTALRGKVDVDGALAALGTLSDPKATETLQEYVLHLENNVHSRKLVLRVLVQAGGRTAIPFLLEVARKRELHLSGEATTALGEIGGPEAQAALESLLDHPQVERGPVFLAMATIGDSRAREVLVRRFESGADSLGYFDALLGALFQVAKKAHDPKVMAILGTLLQERPHLMQFPQRFGPCPQHDPAQYLAWKQETSQYFLEQTQDGRDRRELSIAVELTNHIDLWPELMECLAAKEPSSGRVQSTESERHAELVLQNARRTRAEELYQKGRREMGVGGLKDAALRYLTEAIQVDPTHADAYEARSNVYFFMDRTDEGMADMQKAVELEQQSGIRLRDNAVG